MAQGNLPPQRPPNLQVWVSDAEEDRPLPFAVVVVDSLRLGAQANDSGRAELTLPVGTWAVRVFAVGYEDHTDTVRVGLDEPLSLTVRLQPGKLETESVEVKYKNPAHRIVRNAIRAKEQNGPSAFQAWAVTSYNKLSIAFDNISEKNIEKNLFLRPAREFLRERSRDSTLATDTSGHTSLVFFLSESISEVCFERPNKRREVIKAIKTLGVDNSGANQLSSQLGEIDLYSNYVALLGKQFVSPLNDVALLNYDFAKMGEEVQPNGIDTIYMIELRPRNPYDYAFTGNIWITSADWSVLRAELQTNPKTNLNFVDRVNITQEYVRRRGKYVQELTDVQVNFRNAEKNIGLVGRLVMVFSDYRLDTVFPRGTFGGALVETLPDAQDRDSAYWANARLRPLESSEQQGSEFIRRLQTKSIWKLVRTVMELTAAGSKRFGKIYVGPYGYIVGYNPVEGFKSQIGVFSHPSLHPRWFFKAWGAYGFGDDRFKYWLELRYRPSLKPRVQLTALRTQAVEQTGFWNYQYEGNTFLWALLTFVPIVNLNYYTENRLQVDWDVTKGVMLQAWGRTKRMVPAFDFAWRDPQTGQLRGPYNTTEVGLRLRLSVKEPYLLKNNEKIYLDSKFPVLYLDYAYTAPNLLGSDLEFHHAALALTDNFRLGRLGWLIYTAKLGQIWGNVPYPSLYVIQGNQSLILNTTGHVANASMSIIGGFNRTSTYEDVRSNMLYFFEFVADRYLTVAADWHLDGLILRKLPLIRRLKWRELFTFRLAWGSLTPANLALNNVEVAGKDLLRVQAPTQEPYLELGVGVENIFKLFRIDYIWRLNYHNPDAPGELARFNFNSGVRMNVNLAL